MVTRRDIEGILYNVSQLDKLVQVAMKTVDLDGSGCIDKAELGNIMRQVALDVGDDDPSEQDIDEVFREFDRDQDGKLNYEEFKEIIVRVLKNILNSNML
jgi:Ca2+-binding EF-hand superfamily protein